MRLARRTYSAGRRLLAVTCVMALLLLGWAIQAPSASALTGRFVNAPTGFCLGIRNSSMAGGAYAEIGGCNGTSMTQEWWPRSQIVGSDGAVSYQLVNGVGLCLEVQYASQSAGAQVLQWPCSGTDHHSQFWELYGGGLGNFEMKNFHSGLCLGTKNNGLASGTYVQQQTCDGRATELWHG